MKRTVEAVSIVGLVADLEQYGAYFRQTPGGAWILESTAALPGWLIDSFLRSDERALGAYLRNRPQPDLLGFLAA